MPSLLLSALLATQALAFPVPQGLSGILAGLGGSPGSSSTSAGGLGSLLGGLGGSAGGSGGSLGSLGGLGGLGSGSGSGSSTNGSATGGSGLGSLLGGLGGLGGGSGGSGLGSLLGGLGGGSGGSGSSGSGSSASGSGLGSLLGGLGGGSGGSGSSGSLAGLSGLGGKIFSTLWKLVLRDIGVTANDVQDGVCKGTTFICARGTSEGGNLGETVCPDLANKLKSDLNNDVAVQGVNYPADVEGAVQGGVSAKTAQGSQNMAQLTSQALQKCPNTKVVLAGYSQGAEQVHGALQNLDPSTAGKVSVCSLAIQCPHCVG